MRRDGLYYEWRQVRIDRPGLRNTFIAAMRLLVPLIATLLPLGAAPEKKAPKGVDVTLIAENTAIAAGKPFRVGLRIHHHEKFHTYWQNPGIAGVPTQIAWKLPEGFTAGPIQWPYPEKTLMAIHPVHGYERDVLLAVDIQPPSKIDATKVTLQATATWMACADGCYPGSADLQLSLPVSTQPTTDPATEAAFLKNRTEVPSPLENWAVELLSSKDSKEIQFRLTPKTPAVQAPGELYFFSSDGQVSYDQPQRVEPGNDGSLIVSVMRSEESPKGKTSLPGILKSSAALGPDGKLFASIDPVFPSEP